MSSTSRAWIAVLSLSLALLTGACVGDDGGGVVDESADSSDGTLPRLLIDQSPFEDDDAEMQGVLTYDESTRCFLLDDEGYATAVVWPTGTTLAGGQPVGVVVPDVGDVRVGDRVEGGGGFRSTDSLGDEDAALSECVGSNTEYAVLDHVSDAHTP